MMKAVEIVLSESSHRLCMWHISNHAKQHLASRFVNAEFKAQFNKCFYGCESEIEFESSWATMIENFKLQDHAWLKGLYELCVIQHYEKKAKEFHQIELNQDFQCKNGAPNKVNGRGILKHASNVYTLAMFKRFKEELMDCKSLNCVEFSNIKNISLYHVTEDG
ncbi:hypothetical protein J1N35_010965 [Gossypium stocksii]|uniref:Protein FAR1-RELATED SEQUENCE n=1 Tax=Gossypium stocksii TaxID=47602 RepID=A0A9D3W207_9ROSI|nr:hypothetical protein J1N35_010965 [Gossypium stocksii]